MGIDGVTIVGYHQMDNFPNKHDRSYHCTLSMNHFAQNNFQRHWPYSQIAKIGHVAGILDHSDLSNIVLD